MRLYSKHFLGNCINYKTYSARVNLVNLSRRMSHQTPVNQRVLSIQSHVVSGYCGNKSAVFPLQVLGFDVDPINSVQFSNHTGYSHIKGQVLSNKDLEEIFEGITLNGLHSKYTHLLTGYVGNDTFLRQIAKIIKELREVNPNLVYVCDPVMGDDDFMYVPKELLPIYRDEIIPLADIATPNQFEVELLTGTKIVTEADAWSGMDWFHKQGVKTVALSSSDIAGSSTLLAFLSHKKADGTAERYKLTIPKQGQHIRFTGTGDLFASLFLAHSTLTSNLGSAFESTIATLQSVIEKTLGTMSQEILSGKIKAKPHERELRLVQSKQAIEKPNIMLRATKMD